jgi:Rnl2 family RNA ligase
MEFKKFTSLENTYRQNLIDKVLLEGFDEQRWIVTEKIHGANFSFWYDGEDFKVASRNQFVDGTFYNCQSVINKYEQKIKDWYNNNPCSMIVIYGELYGQGIQKEVVYGEKDFAAFEFIVDGIILNKVDSAWLAYEVGVPFTPILYKGSFKECVDAENKFQSLLTPKGFEGENFAEGVVIEPVIPAWFKNGSRVYFKNKTEAFTEKKNKKEHKPAVGLSEVEQALLDNILEYNSPQRVSNVISKIGQITNKDFPKILGLTIQDILEDFQKETSTDVKKVAEENYKLWSKSLQNEVTKTVREEFVKHLD